MTALGSKPDDISINRLMGCARVVKESKGKTTIAYELKLSSTLLDFFKLRARNHKILYQHHTVNLVEQMLRDVLAKAATHFVLKGEMVEETGRYERLNLLQVYPIRGFIWDMFFWGVGEGVTMAPQGGTT